jgi:hypothetical protein
MMMRVPETRFIRLILLKTVLSHGNEIKVPDILQHTDRDIDWL